MVRVRLVTPLPWQTSHGESMIEPVPRQSSHGSLNPNAPWLRLTIPVPLQCGQTRGLVPGFAPLPWQVVHDARAGQPQRNRDTERRFAESEGRLRLDVACHDGDGWSCGSRRHHRRRD